MFVEHQKSTKPKRKINATFTLREKNQAYKQLELEQGTKYNLQPTYIVPSPLSPVKRLPNTQTESTKSKTRDQEIKNYKLIDCIGRGNFGDVYKAFDMKTQTNVAIKAINVEQSDDDIPILLQEINLLRSLKHPNITNWYKTFFIDVTMFIVMEYCSEGSCLDLLKFNRNGIEETVLSYIMKSVLQGLHYLHDLNIIHRDIKAANILITKNHIIKLADFGVSGQMNGLTGKKTFVGTPYWMAPEIITEVGTLKKDREHLDQRLIDNGLGRKTLFKLWKKKMIQEQIDLERQEKEKLIDCKNLSTKNTSNINSKINELDEVEYNEKVDIWSLGITLIELGTGKVPNSDKEPLKVLFEIPKLEPPKLPQTAGYYAKEFAVACLTKDPILRPSTEELLKFRFITKNKLKYNALNILSGHSNKIKKRKPKFELNFENVNFGPEIEWDLRESPDFQAKQVSNEEEEEEEEEEGNIHNDIVEVESDYEDESSSVYEDETFANSYFGNPPVKNTADTSPLLGGFHNNVSISSDGAQKLTNKSSVSVKELDSDKIREIIDKAGDILQIGNDTCIQDANNAKKTLGCLSKLEDVLVELRHCDAYIVGEVCRRLGDVSAW
ncbi:putative protein serine/threonine kinase [Pichia californica]|uniref:non-specific serine/threonine protein kinase n=1 Tax=Pichia californica TaxID=460514 RepID=A0A9P6WMN8_9ASCO|nr:putative protein serine/threonine kinase [[Candida] californica]